MKIEEIGVVITTSTMIISVVVVVVTGCVGSEVGMTLGSKQSVV